MQAVSNTPSLPAGSTGTANYSVTNQSTESRTYNLEGISVRLKAVDAADATKSHYNGFVHTTVAAAVPTVAVVSATSSRAAGTTSRCTEPA